MVVPVEIYKDIGCKKSSKVMEPPTTKCYTCSMVIAGTENCIECKGCFRWFHSKCIGVQDASLLDLFTNLSRDHWFCAKGITRFSRLEQKMTNLSVN